jgi:hypothetical protein
MANTATAHKASQAATTWDLAQPSNKRSVRTNKAETPAANKTVAKNWVSPIGVLEAEGSRLVCPHMVLVAVFMVFSLGLIFCNFELLMIRMSLHHRVFTSVVQLYIHDRGHS